MYSLSTSLIDSLLSETIPSFQLTCKKTRNLGFGGIFYSISRALRPARTVVIGSKAGFAPILFALAAKDNEGATIEKIDCESIDLQTPSTGIPHVHFIDPSYSIERNDKNHWYGLGNWDEPDRVAALWRKYNVEGVIQHFKMTSREYLASFNDQTKIDLLYVDGDHSYEGILHDLTAFHGRLSPTAMILAHDVDPRCPEAQGYAVLSSMDQALYEWTRVPVYPGLAILRPR